MDDLTPFLPYIGFFITMIVVVAVILITMQNKEVAKIAEKEKDKKAKADVNAVWKKIYQEEFQTHCNSFAQHKDLPENPIRIKFMIKGIAHMNPDAILRTLQLETGDDLILQAEPHNPYDPDAVKVYSTDGFHIGYVDANHSFLLSGILHLVKSCKVKWIHDSRLHVIQAEVIQYLDKDGLYSKL